jgi:hypothetical protein
MSLRAMIESAIRELLPADRCRRLFGEGHPLLADMRKVDDWHAHKLAMPVDDVGTEHWTLSHRARFYSCVSLNAKDMKTPRAAMENVDYQCTKAIKDLGKLVASGLYTRNPECDSLLSLDDWMPAMLPSGYDDHCGIDRLHEPSRFFGRVLNAQGMLIMEAIEWADHWAAKNQVCKSAVDWYAHPSTCRGLPEEWPGKKGPIRVQADVDCPRDAIFRMRRGAFTLATSDVAPHMVEHEDGHNLAIGNNDGYELMFVVYGNTVLQYPSDNIRLVVSP